MADHGWQFCVEYRGTVRMFAVGAFDEETAMLAVQRERPDIGMLNFLSKQRLPDRVIELLQLKGGKVMEWFTADHSPTPVQGMDIGSDYDPYKGKA